MMFIMTVFWTPSSAQKAREYKGERFIALFNFSENEQTAWMQEEGIFRNLVNGEIVEVKDPVLKGYEFVWMKYKA